MTGTVLKIIKDKYFSNCAGDLIGGLTSAIVALPIALAFGVATGLGAQAGLYGAIACGILAALLGGTPGQISGPTGPMTVVIAAMFAANPTRPELVFAAVFAGGLLQILLGYMRAGQLIHYIPYPVISGFMTGIGTIIILLQLRPLFGLSASGDLLAALQSIPELLLHPNMNALMIGTITLAIIYVLPRVSQRLPAMLFALAVGSMLNVWLKLDTAVIGEIPSKLPVPLLPMIKLTDLHIVLSNAISLAVLGSIDSLLTSVVVDKIAKTRHNSNQELIGQGIGNMSCGLIGALPGAGATMRSVVNVRSGGRTRLAGVIHGLILLAVLVGLGPVAGQIPLACLAGVLISVGISIMDYRGLRSMRKAPREDVAVMLMVYFLTVFVDLIIAVGVGVALACTLFAKRLSDAKLCKIDTLESLEHLHQVSQTLTSDLRSSIYFYTFNGPLFFGEVKNFTQVVDEFGQARYIILRFSNVSIVDQTGAYALEEAIEKWESSGVKVLFTGLHGPVRQTLEDVGVIHKIAMENCFDHSEEAIEAIVQFEHERHTVLPGDSEG
ncbi:MAG: SulP family inorganic anion transporter [Candidatus Melainabacteria bacterium]|nr:SulP family inorganic anion transporter [Candidatus Melainabacteria bacterium]